MQPLKYKATDILGTRRLLAMAREAGVGHTDVASRLVAFVLSPPAGMLPDFGGPEVRNFKSIAESWLKARRMNKPMFNLWLPIKFSRQFAAGRLLCPEHRDGTVTFEQYLERKYGGGS